MSLFIEVYVGSKTNRKLVADVHAYNDSNLADVSDYVFKSYEKGEPMLGIEKSISEGRVEGHNRNQSVWSLVGKIVDCLR